MSERHPVDRVHVLLFVCAAVILAFPLITHPFSVAFYPEAAYSDLLITHWPNAELLRSSIRTWGQIPLWNPLVLSGSPFAADPLAGIWYMPLWLAQVIPAVPAFNLLFVVHLILTGWGLFQFMKEHESGSWGALLAAVAWMGGAKWSAHIALGHVTLVLAVAWTPWLLLIAGRIGRDDEHWMRWSAVGGGLLGLIALIDPRWVVPAGFVAAAYAWWICEQHMVDRKQIIIAGGISAGMAFLFSAPISLPLLQCVPLSTRASLSSVEQGYLSLPWVGLLGLLFPVSGQPEWTAYVGSGFLLLSLVSLLSHPRRQAFWAGLMLFALVFALGENTLLFPLLSRLPALNLLRVPPRLLFLFMLGGAILAGGGLDALQQGITGKAVFWSRLGTAGLGAVVLLMGGFLLIQAESLSSAALLAGLGFGGASIVWCFVSLAGNVDGRTAAYGWLVIISLDLAVAGSRLLELRSGVELLNDRTEIAEVLDTGDLQRSFSPSYSLPQQTAARYGIQMADGVSPMQLDSYVAFLSEATGIDMDAYSVTVPPFPSGDPTEPIDVELDTEMLGRLNVAWILADYPLDSADILFETQIDGVWVYTNPDVRPRAWVEEAEDEETWWAVDTLEWSPNRIDITARGPGRLVLSEMVYPGWSILVDGVETDPAEDGSPLRAVDLDEGIHTVQFLFRPVTVYLGAGLMVLGLAVLVWLWRYR